MALRFAGEPVGAAEAIHRALVRNAGTGRGIGGRPEALDLLGAGPNINLAAPHPVFDLQLDQLAAGAGLGAAKPAGWRFLIMRGQAAIGSAEVVVDVGGAASQVSALNTGPFVASTERGIRSAERLPQVEHGSFELRLLRIPALYILALWLKNTSDASDIIIPLPPAPRYVEQGHPYGPAEFLQRLRGLAKDRLAFDDTPRK